MTKSLSIAAGLCAMLLLAVFFAKDLSKTPPLVYSQNQGAAAALALQNSAPAGTSAASPLASAAPKTGAQVVVSPLKPYVSTPGPFVAPATAPSNPFVQAPEPIVVPPISFGYQYAVPFGAGQGAGSSQTTVHIPVIILDTTAPVITASSNVSAEATSSLGAYVAYTLPTANDAVSGSAAVLCAPLSNSLFALGTTTVTCSASDTAGNTATSTFAVVVVDTTRPTIAPASASTAEATSSLGAYVSYIVPTSTDTVSGSLTTTCVPVSNSRFALGTTTVTCSATDGAGNTATRSFTVHVVDTTKPTIASSSAMTAEATSSLGAYVSYTTPTSTDLVSGTLTPTCASSSGSLFAFGTTTVLCSASDTAGNTATSSFNIIVVDTTKPTIASSTNITAEATSSLGAYVTYTVPTSTDTVSGSLVTTCNASSSSLFALGTSTILCSATDTPGNTATSSFYIFVVDTTAPVIASTTDLFVVATSSSSTFATVTYTAPTATDLVKGTFAATCATSSGSLFAVGTTTVICTATDVAGNTATSTFDVVVTVPPAGSPPGTSFIFAASQTDESYPCPYGFASCFQGTTTAPLDTQTFDLGSGSTTLQGGTLSSITIALDPTYATTSIAWTVRINCSIQSIFSVDNRCTDWAPTNNYFIAALATTTQDLKHWTAYFTPITFNPSYFYQLLIDDNGFGIPAFGSQSLAKPYFRLNGVTQ